MKHHVKNLKWHKDTATIISLCTPGYERIIKLKILKIRITTFKHKTKGNEPPQ